MDKEMFSFYKEALLNNLCDEYKGYWKSAGEDKEKLVSLCLAQQSIPFFASYCYWHKGLSKEYILKEFADYVNGRELYDCDGVHGYTYGLFVDHHANVMPLKVDISHFIWCEGITIEVEETKCPTIYVSNTSNIHLVCGGYNNIRIMLFDDSTIHLDDVDDESTIRVFRYNKNANVIQEKYCLSNDIKVFDKELRL